MNTCLMTTKKTYQIPTIEVLTLALEMPIALAVSKESVPGGAPRRWTEVF